jgi:signal transduction histidine kinase
VPLDTDRRSGEARSSWTAGYAFARAHSRSVWAWAKPYIGLGEKGYGLSAKLLSLTVLFVMLAEVLIFVPSIANYRTQWLNDRLSSAQLASIAAEAFPGGEVPPGIRQELLRVAQVRMIAVKRNERRNMVLREDMETEIAATYDLRPSNINSASNPFSWFAVRGQLILDALTVFTTDDKRFIRVIGQPSTSGGDFIEIVLPQRPLRLAMVRHGLNILALSILISALAGGLVYLALNSLFVRPLMRITHNMVRFSANPEDASRIITPSTRTDEIGTAEQELARMQSELNQMLAQKSRLAALGLAVSKINHDMRNMLANAQLLSDNLTSVPDARVQRFAPKLIASLDRAIKFCNDTLRFGRAAEAAPKRELIALLPLVEEVGEGLGLPRNGCVSWKLDMPAGLKIDADRDQLYRVLSNLARNAAQAIEAQTPAAPGSITVRASRTGDLVRLDMTDDGPGLPDLARSHLFKAFQGSTRKGGSGLGLVIAQELILAHGGRLWLVEDSAGPKVTAQRGAHFRIEIADRSVAD